MCITFILINLLSIVPASGGGGGGRGPFRSPGTLKNGVHSAKTAEDGEAAADSDEVASESPFGEHVECEYLEALFHNYHMYIILHQAFSSELLFYHYHMCINLLVRNASYHYQPL